MIPVATGGDPFPEPTPGPRPSTPPPSTPPPPVRPEAPAPGSVPAAPPDPPGPDAPGPDGPGTGDGPDHGRPADGVPATTTEKPRRAGSGTGRLLAPAALLGGAAAVQLLALVPAQGASMPALGDQASNIGAQAVLAAGLLAAAVLVAPGRRSAVAGAAVAAGITLADVGQVVASVGTVQGRTKSGAGEMLLVLAWAMGAVGTVLAVRSLSRRGIGGPGRPRRKENALLTVVTAVMAVLLGAAFLPSWDSYRLTFIGGARTIEAGSAFTVHNAVGVTVGDLIAATLFALVPIIAMLWRPGRIGILMIAGVVVVVAGQALEAVLQLAETTTSAFALPAEARAIGLTVHSSLTAWYDLEVLAALVLLVLVVVRWWTPAGESRRDPRFVDGDRGAIPGPGAGAPGAIDGAPFGTVGYGAPPWSPAADIGGGPQGSTARPGRTA